MVKLIDRYINKMVELTTIVEVDENGEEHKKTWTVREYITSKFVIALCLIVVIMLL